MAKLRNHNSFWLRDDAAAAFDRAEAAEGVFQVNSAARTVGEQRALIIRYDKGGPGNRPPALYNPARPPEKSGHVRQGGIAVDLRDWRRFALVCEKYGYRHTYPDGDPVHFDFVGGVGAGPVTPAPGYKQVTFDRQNFLKTQGHPDLVADGREGPRTRAVYKEYQTFLRKWGYKGIIDGDWGNGTQTAHQKFYDSLQAKPAAPTSAPAKLPASQYHTATPADLASLAATHGLQKVARANGYRGEIDNDFGPNSQAGLQAFLNRNYRGSLARWLRTKWGYRGADDLWGPNMKLAAERANAANMAAL